MGESVQGIARAAERGGRLTSQLLAFSRRNVLQPRRLDLNEVLTNLSSLLHRTLGEDINYQFDYASDLPPIHADPGLLEQVIMNLAVNARDAMPRGGQLVISTSLANIDESHVERHPGEARPGRFTCLSITDTGCGMDHLTMSRIFEPFFTTKELGKGTGLGLSTVYGIVQQSEGGLFVYSEPGRGTTFKVYLPQVDEAPDVPRSLDAADQSGSETVLLVEDEPALRALTKRVLSSAGYTVIDAGNGDEALAALAAFEGPVDLMLTDVVMPGMNGRDLATRVIALRPAIKVLFASGYTDDAIFRHGVLDDGSRFISKPYAPAELRRKVREALG
jgi:CheY-like chemotaxis protein